MGWPSIKGQATSGQRVVTQSPTNSDNIHIPIFLYETKYVRV